VSALRTEAGKRYVTVVHVSHIKGYHLPDNEEPFEGNKDNEQDVETMMEDVPTAVNEEVEQTESFKIHSKRERKAPVWHASYKM